ncbi:MAG: site-specific integrase [Planctomycetes bacterium]|nr:site-specific integrase [Planctomycetota bacterium]MBI3833434.1 site-specific integrase [Planctomycetota bacterium]
MPRRGPNRRKRVPKLSFMESQGVGWHVSYRDATTGAPRRHRFGIVERDGEERARALYHAWVAKQLGIDTSHPTKHERPWTPKIRGPIPLSGSLIEIGSSLINSERARIRHEGDPQRRGTIDPRVFSDRKKQIHDFFEFLNRRHGDGAVAKLRLLDVTMDDIEAYNRHIADSGYSASQVTKRMQVVRAIIDRAGRPEHGLQLLTWNWNARDKAHGKTTEERLLPKTKQLERLLQAADLRGRTMIWLGIGLGFGAKDLSKIRVGQITKEAYDLRRGKTGIERYGETPSLVWAMIAAYQRAEKRAVGELLFLTRTGRPLVHGPSNAVTQWWDKLRARARKKGETIPGFYTLRHLGATEFGSRRGASISDVKRWLGHSASSHMADVYMKPVRPEYREIIEWVRARLASKKLDA